MDWSVGAMQQQIVIANARPNASSRPHLPMPPQPAHAGMVAALLSSNPPPLPEEQAQQFIQEFKRAYGDVHPRFVASGWRQATAAAFSEYKFLFVYIHSPEHEVCVARVLWVVRVFACGEVHGAMGGRPSCMRACFCKSAPAGGCVTGRAHRCCCQQGRGCQCTHQAMSS